MATSDRPRRRMTIPLAILGILALAVVALWIAIRVNGPAVLDTVDRIAGWSRDVERVETHRYGNAPTQTVSVHRPAGGRDDTALPILVFVHGGSWATGDPAHYNFIARALAPDGFIVALAGYRLGESGRYPAMLEDTAAAIGWVRANAARLGGDPDRILLAGHSAGAYNVVQAALEPRWLDAEGVPPKAIRGVIGLAGPYDFYPLDKPSTKAAFGNAPDGEATQPVNHVRSDAPPMLLMTGLDDTTVKPRNTRALAARLEEADAEVEAHYFKDMDHTRILLEMADPWSRSGRTLGPMRAFLTRIDAASVPVQRKTR